MMSEKARVRRGGKDMDVPAEDLVLGDLVLVESGVRIPADLRIIQTDSLKVRSVMYSSVSVGRGDECIAEFVVDDRHAIQHRCPGIFNPDH